VEPLEGRELLSYTPLGYSLPDLVVSGFTAPATSWGGQLAVTVNVRNQGASTLPEPLALQPGSTSTADAQPTEIVVLASPNRLSRIEVPIGVIETPVIPQNSLVQISQTFTMPSQPLRFPGQTGKIFIHFAINPDQNVLESDYSNNLSQRSVVLLEPKLPAVRAVAMGTPPVMQPGDTIAPVIQLENFGAGDPGDQKPLQVALVASTSKKFGPGSTVLALYTVSSVPPISIAPTQTENLKPQVIYTPNNFVTINSPAVTLPGSPRVYYIGVVVDPNNQIKKLGKINRQFKNDVFTLVRKVGPPIKGLPPAGVVTAGGGANNPPFPFPIAGIAGFPTRSNPPTIGTTVVPPVITIPG
jgi:hypothetical protein